MKDNGLNARWAAGQSALGLWLSGAGAAATETLAELRYDYINIDMQHGMIDYGDVVPLLTSLQGSGATLTARVPWNEPGIIGKVLDAGVQGVIIPMVNTVAEAEAATRACRYAPVGSRSYGPIRAARSLGPDYYAEANDKIVCIPMIETVEALSNLDAILDVPGIDAVYVGPADLSISLGLPPGSNNDDDSFQDALKAILDGCAKRGIAAGIHSDTTWAPVRLEQGFTMVTITSDTQAMAQGAADALRAVTDAAPGAGGGGDSMY
ncbi:MAG: aldolase/citrate lyase family protein [Actinomycetota bacterium]